MNVLLINDNPAISRLISLSMKKFSYEFHEVSSVDDIYPCDILIIDSKIDFDESFKSLAKHIVLILPKNYDKQEYDKLGVSVLTKPFLPTDFVDLVRGFEGGQNEISKELPKATSTKAEKKDEIDELDLSVGLDELDGFDDLMSLDEKDTSKNDDMGGLLDDIIDESFDDLDGIDSDIKEEDSSLGSVDLEGELDSFDALGNENNIDDSLDGLDSFDEISSDDVLNDVNDTDTFEDETNAKDEKISSLDELDSFDEIKESEENISLDNLDDNLENELDSFDEIKESEEDISLDSLDDNFDDEATIDEAEAINEEDLNIDEAFDNLDNTDYEDIEDIKNDFKDLLEDSEDKSLDDIAKDENISEDDELLDSFDDVLGSDSLDSIDDIGNEEELSVDEDTQSEISSDVDLDDIKNDFKDLLEDDEALAQTNEILEDELDSIDELDSVDDLTDEAVEEDMSGIDELDSIDETLDDVAIYNDLDSVDDVLDTIDELDNVDDLDSLDSESLDDLMAQDDVDNLSDDSDLGIDELGELEDEVLAQTNEILDDNCDKYVGDNFSLASSIDELDENHLRYALGEISDDEFKKSFKLDEPLQEETSKEATPIKGDVTDNKTTVNVSHAEASSVDDLAKNISNAILGIDKSLLKDISISINIHFKD